jgi:hypothetical protein
MDVAKNSKEPVARETAIMLLANYQHLDVLPLVRKMVKEEKGGLKLAAYRCIGVFGHPEDFATLAAALESKDPDELWSYSWALYEYGDMRATAKLLPLLDTENEKLRREVGATVLHLLTPEALQALLGYRGKTEDETEKQFWTGMLSQVFGELGTSEEEYSKKTDEEKKEFFKGLYAKMDAQYALKEGDRKLTREEFLKAIEEWKENGRLRHGGGEYDWVGITQMLSVAKPEDINLLLEVKSKLYRRLSDECVPEVKQIDEVVRYLGRSRYRKNPGVCEKVEPKDK